MRRCVAAEATSPMGSPCRDQEAFEEFKLSSCFNQRDQGPNEALGTLFYPKKVPDHVAVFEGSGTFPARACNVEYF